MFVQGGECDFCIQIIQYAQILNSGRLLDTSTVHTGRVQSIEHVNNEFRRNGVATVNLRHEVRANSIKGNPIRAHRSTNRLVLATTRFFEKNCLFSNQASSQLRLFDSPNGQSINRQIKITNVSNPNHG